MQWLDKTPLTLLIFVSIVLLIAPVSPQPHVVQKLSLLKKGELTRFLDIFDLVMHLTPTFLLIVKLFRMTGRS